MILKIHRHQLAALSLPILNLKPFWVLQDPADRAAYIGTLVLEQIDIFAELVGKSWISEPNSDFMLGKYRLQLIKGHPYKYFKVKNHQACLEEVQSPDGTGDWWEFGEDGALLISGSFENCCRYISIDWEPLPT